MEIGISGRKNFFVSTVGLNTKVVEDYEKLRKRRYG